MNDVMKEMLKETGVANFTTLRYFPVMTQDNFENL
jgi:hypothetical protein